MAHIQEEVTRYSWELLLRFLGLTGDVLSNAERAGEFAFDKAEQATKGILTLMIDKARDRAREKGGSEDDNLKVLQAMEVRAQKNKEVLRNVLIADEDATEFAEKLKENNVLFVMRDIGKDNAKLFMYMSGDDYSVQKAVNSLMAERGLITEMDAEEFIDVRLKNGVGTVDALNDMELEAFRMYAKSEKLPFAKIRTRDNNNLIIYEPEKSKEVKKVLSAAVWALSGRQGKEISKALDAKIKARRELYVALEDKKEHVIVSGKNEKNFLLIDEKEAVLYKNDKKVQNVSRENKDFFEKVLQMSDGLEDPVVLHKGEYALNGSVEELRAVFHKELLQKKLVERIPERELNGMFEEANERRRLVEEKMALDDEHQDPFWIFDEGYSYSSASEHEQIDDNDEEKRDEQEAIEKTARRLKSLGVDEVTSSAPRGIDAIIARAEQRRAEKVKSEKESQKGDRSTISFFSKE
ncbi:MAG: hypothetical protein IJZ42_13555 [Lachnospiraceae bacterium]|nr:hypothetical protein [Lachnospiraceae bacterium]